MKRDVNLCRQLLLDIENHGTDCSLSALGSGLAHDSDERIRYHVRLLIDAGLVKEIDRTTAGVPCIRLTNAGQEFLELARSEARWREAKWVAREQTGGQSLTVIRTLLTRWAVEAVARTTRQRRLVRPYRPYYGSHASVEPGYRYEAPRYLPPRPEKPRYEPYRPETGCRHDPGVRYEPIYRPEVAYPRDLLRYEGELPTESELYYGRPAGVEYGYTTDRSDRDDYPLDRDVYEAPRSEAVDPVFSITLPISMV